jgi:hypothetical protein
MAIFGNGATIKETPLINILVSSTKHPNCILDVVDCSDHMSCGGKKDAWYICRILLHKIEMLEHNKTLFDLITLDGASNIQKAGEHMAKQYHQCTVIQGI